MGPVRCDNSKQLITLTLITLRVFNCFKTMIFFVLFKESQNLIILKHPKQIKFVLKMKVFFPKKKNLERICQQTKMKM
jgi:hypothetical protein